MRAKLLSARRSVTRTSRRDPRGPALESLAAEFALLAQRRARLARQVDLLERQWRGATASLQAVQGRMAQLTHEMARLEPGLLPPPVIAPAPPAPPPPPPSATRRGLTIMKPHALPGTMRPAARPLSFRP